MRQKGKVAAYIAAQWRLFKFRWEFSRADIVQRKDKRFVAAVKKRWTGELICSNPFLTKHAAEQWIKEWI